MVLSGCLASPNARLTPHSGEWVRICMWLIAHVARELLRVYRTFSTAADMAGNRILQLSG